MSSVACKVAGLYHRRWSRSSNVYYAIPVILRHVPVSRSQRTAAWSRCFYIYITASWGRIFPSNTAVERIDAFMIGRLRWKSFPHDAWMLAIWCCRWYFELPLLHFAWAFLPPAACRATLYFYAARRRRYTQRLSMTVSKPLRALLFFIYFLYNIGYEFTFLPRACSHIYTPATTATSFWLCVDVMVICLRLLLPMILFIDIDYLLIL